MKLGCPSLTESTYCDAHSPAERPKKNDPPLSYDNRWRKLRQMFIAKHPVCRACEIKGRTTPAQEVDHIIPWRGNVTLLRADWNLQSLCRSCHHKKTRADELWVPLRFPNPPTHGRQQLTVICGPPAVGKTTKAHELGAPVVDLDDIYRELGVTHRMVTPELLQSAMRIRNARIAEPFQKTMVGMFPRRHERRFWSEIWGAKVLLLLAPEDELKKRMTPRPFSKRGHSYQALERWRASYEKDEEL